MNVGNARVTAHVGADYLESGVEGAQMLRRNGSHFDWVAFACAPVSMWDLHIGVVLEGLQLTVGVHIHQDAIPRLSSLLMKMGLDLVRDGASRHAEAASEYHWDTSSWRVSPDFESLASVIEDVTTQCVRLVEVLDQGSQSSPPDH